MGFYCTDRPFYNCKLARHGKEHQERQITDFTIPYDTRVDDKKVEKIEKYLDLARELKKVWHVEVTVIPLLVGALGTPAKNPRQKIEDHWY